jgi:hypothetical protein
MDLGEMRWSGMDWIDLAQAKILNLFRNFIHYEQKLYLEILFPRVFDVSDIIPAI